MRKTLPAVFITYNPKSEFERTLAFRLHTLGAVHGYHVSLPDRQSVRERVSPETHIRIVNSDYFILFSTSKLSATVEEEIKVAWEHLHDKSKIIIIYDGVKNLKNTQNCTEIIVDSDKMSLEQIAATVMDKLKSNYTVVPTKNGTKDKKNNDNVLAGLLIAGLGLLLLGALLEDSK